MELSYILKNAEYILYLFGIVLFLIATSGRASFKGNALNFATWQRIALLLIGILAVILGLIPRLMLSPSHPKQQVFDNLTTELSLDGTTWTGEYEDRDGNNSMLRQGIINFHQHGSRITGEGNSSDAQRQWFIEGVAYKGRLCYIYVDKDPNVVSIGTAAFELNAAGNRLEGHWTGWAPEGTQSEPRRIVLSRVKHKHEAPYFHLTRKGLGAPYPRA